MRPPDAAVACVGCTGFLAARSSLGGCAEEKKPAEPAPPARQADAVAGGASRTCPAGPTTIQRRRWRRSSAAAAGGRKQAADKAVGGEDGLAGHGRATGAPSVPRGRRRRPGPSILRDRSSRRSRSATMAIATACSPAITSRCCDGARAPRRAFTATRSTGARPIWSSVDLGQFDDELKGRRIAGQVEDGRLVPYRRPGRDRCAARSPAAKLELLWVDDPVDRLLPRDPGLGPGRAAGRRDACASATPTRTAGPTARSART